MMLIQFQKGSLFGNMHKVQIASQLETPLFDSWKLCIKCKLGWNLLLEVNMHIADS